MKYLSKRSILNIALILCCLTASIPAYADVGLPMVFITTPLFGIAIIPVIIIESIVLLRYLKINKTLAFKTATISNLVSTFVGIPISWIVLLIIQLTTWLLFTSAITNTSIGYAIRHNDSLRKFLNVTWLSPWLFPYESELYWMIPTATAVLLVPFFFVSWFIEYKISKIILKHLDEKILIKKAVFIGNLLTYAMLEMMVLSYLIWILFFSK